jgi:hypothetical protein
MCNCKDIDLSTNDRFEVLIVPDNMELYYTNQENQRRYRVSIDKCLVDEIKHLWSLGIKTTGCCCGHNIVPPYIGVTDDCIPKMKELGYKVTHNPKRPESEDSFLPKSI